MKKSPLRAGLLNFFIPGLGYLYLGKRKTFGWLILAGAAILLGGDILTGFKHAPPMVPYTLISGNIILFALGYDAYQEAKNM